MFVIVEICERELLCMTYANTKEEASDIANTKLENIIEHKYGLSMEDYFADYGDDGDAEKSENGSNAWCNFSPYGNWDAFIREVPAATASELAATEGGES